MHSLCSLPHVRKLNRAFAALAMLVVWCGTAPAQQAPFDRAGFASDFALTVTTLRNEHPKLQLIRERAAFDSVVRNAEARLATAGRVASYLELVRVVSSLEDGHTGLQLSTLNLQRYSVEVSVFSDGLYITRTSNDAARALGLRVKRIGGLAIEDVVKRLRPYLTADNESGRLNSLPPRIVLHELLEQVGAATARGSWWVGTHPSGQTDSVFLSPGMDQAILLSARDTTAPFPEYLAHRTRPFWFAVHRPIVYAQINNLTREPQGAYAAFVDSVFTAVETSGADALVIDLRLNGGGDGTLTKALVQRIIRTPAINRRNHLFVLIGRATFSAAVIMTAALENETEATFIGEPTGAPANHYGEPARIELPATKLRLSYSKLYWQNGDPRDMRPDIPPAIPAPLSFADWRDNRDPAMEMVFGMNGAPASGRSRPLPAVHVAGTYPTRVALLTDACGGTNVESMTTTVEQAQGAAAIVLTHAGQRYDATVRGDGVFNAVRKTLAAGNLTYRIDIAGAFSVSGFRAMVTVEMSGGGRATPCTYTVGWIGTKDGPPNVIPGR